MRQLVGYLSYDTEAELLLLNRIWKLLCLIGNHFYPQQKLVSKVRDGAKVTKKYDTATTAYARVMDHSDVRALPKRRLRSQRASFNPAAVQRQIQALADELLTLATAKGQPSRKPAVTTAGTRTFSDEATGSCGLRSVVQDGNLDVSYRVPGTVFLFRVSGAA